MKQTDIHDAIKRIALTSDGRDLHLYLQQIAMSPCTLAEGGALQMHEGRRTFALELKGLMDEAYTSAEPNSDGRPKPGQSIVVIQRGAVAYAGTRALGRRVEPYAKPDGSDAA